MRTLYENDFQTLYVNNDGDFIIWYHGDEQKEHKFILGRTPDEAKLKLESIYEDGLIKYLTQY